MNLTVQAALWMTGAVFSFTAMAIAGRELGGTFDTFEIMMYRSAFGFAIVLLLVFATGAHRQIGIGAARTHFFRNVFHFTGQNLWFYAVTMVPLAKVFALEFTTPLWVIVLSFLLLGERLTKVRALAAILGFVGILIVARPGAMTDINTGMAAAASCAVFFALTYVFTKRLTRTETIAAIMFYLTFFQLIFGIIMAGYDGVVAAPTAATMPWLVLVACCGLLAHFCITKALTIAPATVVAPIDFARLPLVAVAAMLLYNEVIDLWVFVGAVIIFGGNYLNIWFETRKAA
ncbi:S-adenosylmethionine uptake transporter [Sulfitobacter noctilucicola]|uniref:Drug/metabolite transporter (DMT)-like permease n=1 Tax=Sulfitobacter noctilucicola TaxID=1342301 RepID=A0A7W6M7W1_9RHOB|nr:DMT family transporter [Sulfitobacter noctilucicola]KIN65163.1 S-adenosylmethionine uptake transporter [Sulfitobacter noctilucicola]MBB4173703.1 drug/metabolite transporter (DMT)-like permease [Sulfitobacter noctilucicola]